MINANGAEVDTNIIGITVDVKGRVYGLSDEGNIYVWNPTQVRWELYKLSTLDAVVKEPIE